MNRIKVAHVANTDFFIKKLLLNKLIGLKDKGYEIHAIAPVIKQYKDDIEKKGIAYHEIPIYRKISIFKDIIAIIKLASLFRKEKFHIVHTHSSKGGVIGRIAAKIAGVPVIIHTTHGLPFYEGQNVVKFHIYKSIERLVGRISDVIFSQNYEDLENIKKYKIGKQALLLYEGNGVNIQEIDNRAKQTNKEKLKKELSINGKVVIGFYARLEPVKGHLFFFESFSKVIKKHRNVVCLLAGSNFGIQNQYSNQIYNSIKKFGLENNIKVLGFREDIPELLTVTDILVLPSEKEGIPRIIMEAMALRVPVVATNVLGTKELVKNDNTGILVAYKDVLAMIDALITLIENKELRIQYGIAGRKIIEDFYDENKVINRIDNCYKKLTEKIYCI